MSSFARVLLPFLFLVVPAKATDWPFQRTVGITHIEPFQQPTKWGSDCVQYCTASLMKAIGHEITAELYDSIGNDINPNQKGVHFEIFAKYLDRYFATEVTQANPTALAQHLCDGFPVVVSLETDSKNDQGNNTTHAVIVTAYTVTPDNKYGHWKLEDNGYMRGDMSHDEFIRRWSQPSYPWENETVFIRPKSEYQFSKDAVLTFDREQGWQETPGRTNFEEREQLEPVRVPPAPAPDPFANRDELPDHTTKLAQYNIAKSKLEAIRDEMESLPFQLVSSLENLKPHPRIPLKKREQRLRQKLTEAYENLPVALQTFERQYEVYDTPFRDRLINAQPIEWRPESSYKIIARDPGYHLEHDDLQHHLDQLKVIASSGYPDQFLAPYPDLETEIEELTLRAEHWPTYPLNQHAIKERLAFLTEVQLHTQGAEDKAAVLQAHFKQQFQAAYKWSKNHTLKLADQAQQNPKEHGSSFALGFLFASILWCYRSRRRNRD